MALHLFIVITILTALSLSSPAGFPVSAPTSIPLSPRIALWGSSNGTGSSHDTGSSNDTSSSNDTPWSNDPDPLNNVAILHHVAILGILILVLGVFVYFLIWRYLRSDDRKKKKAAEQAGAGEDQGHEDGGKGDEGDGGDEKAYEGEGKVN